MEMNQRYTSKSQLTQDQLNHIRTYLDVPEETLDLILTSLPGVGDPVDFIIKNFGNEDEVLARKLQENEWNVSNRNLRHLSSSPEERPVFIPNREPLRNDGENRSIQTENIQHVREDSREEHIQHPFPIIESYNPWDFDRHRSSVESRANDEAKEEFKDIPYPPVRELPYIADRHNHYDRFIPEQNDNEDDMTYERLVELDKSIYDIGKGMSEEELSMIPEIQFSSSQNQKTCSICQCDFEEGERISLIACFHLFHKECIWNWLLRRKNCPVCLYKV